ncbi:MAG TPA: ATP phosphoribosyltransferase regulatory subunit, partial [Solirubrobacterales bacterium]|nr:ATP phosphoribosyltransferase regulatory subunit [Solirubrobacterales bacterium]
VLEQARELDSAAVTRAADRLGDIYRGLADRDGGYRVQFDFGLMRDLAYYNGAILEVYDPAVGHVLGGGGRYDGLMKRFGLDFSAAGFALNLERVHVAQIEERRRQGEGR